jgi:protein-S-isoprenylcysteine O-methyltransferase Ste14
LLGADRILLLMVPALLLLHYGGVKREEQYLEKKFGESYRSYKAFRPALRLEVLSPAQAGLSGPRSLRSC